MMTVYMILWILHLEAKLLVLLLLKRPEWTLKKRQMVKNMNMSTSITITTRTKNMENPVPKVNLYNYGIRYTITFYILNNFFKTSASQSTSNTPPASQQTNSRSKENNKSKKPAVVQEENKFAQSTHKSRLVIFDYLQFLANTIILVNIY